MSGRDASGDGEEGDERRKPFPIASAINCVIQRTGEHIHPIGGMREQRLLR
jgi:hypothetical protein